MRENRPYGSEGGVDESRSRPLSYRVIHQLSDAAGTTHETMAGGYRSRLKAGTTMAAFR
jgi:hypothetical protein